jgi:hypothetical protein
MAKRRTSGRAGSKGTFIQASRGVSSEQKAIYHHVAGAGRSRVVRSFFDLTDADENVIQEQVDLYLTRMLDKAS